MPALHYHDTPTSSSPPRAGKGLSTLISRLRCREKANFVKTFLAPDNHSHLPLKPTPAVRRPTADLVMRDDFGIGFAC